MTLKPDDDALSEALSGLPMGDVAPERAERIRGRCHAVLSRRRRGRQRLAAYRLHAWASRLETAAVGVMAVLYLLGAVSEGLWLLAA